MTLSNHRTRTVPEEQIATWICSAADSKSWRPGLNRPSNPVTIPVTDISHAARIQSSLDRARSKTFVKLVKPFRRLFRNQGAVNDSLIEAVYHLAVQNREMMEELSDLRRMMNDLRSQARRVPGGRATPVTPKLPSHGPSSANDSCA